jgi:hypothetical protein
MPDSTDLRNVFDSSHANENTYFKICSHVLQRGWHIGSVVGTALVVPTVLAKDETAKKNFNQYLDAGGKAAVGVGGLYGTYLLRVSSGLFSNRNSRPAVT